MMLDLLFQFSFNSLTRASGLDSFMVTFGYFGVFFLMLLENASLPVPSEIVLPLIGYFAARGTFDFVTASFVVLLGEVVGIAIDYYLAYYVGRNFVYKYFGKIGVKRERIDEFEVWFKHHGSFTVFVARLMPVLRGLISFPAGFAKMQKRKFFFYSIVGSMIWNFLLMIFGYYALGITQVTILVPLIAGFLVVLYLIYTYSLRRIERESKLHAKQAKK